MNATVEALQSMLDTEIVVRQYSDGLDEHKRLLPSIVCADGFRMSVQASSMHFCKPKGNAGPYTHVEVYTDTVEQFKPYAETSWHGEDDEEYFSGLFFNVPIELVVEVINDHGGFKQME